MSYTQVYNTDEIGFAVGDTIGAGAEALVDWMPLIVLAVVVGMLLTFGGRALGFLKGLSR